MLKRFILSALCAACVAVPSFADTEIHTFIDGRPVVLRQGPVLYQGAVLVPLADLVETSGGRVVFDPVTRTYTANHLGRIIKVDLDENVAWVNGRSVALSSAPVDVNGRVLVPITFAQEALGYNLDWQPTTSTLKIVTTPSTAVVVPASTVAVVREPVALETTSYYSRYSADPTLLRPLSSFPATTSVDAISMNVVNNQSIPEVFTLQGRTAPNATVRVTTIKQADGGSDAYTLQNRAKDYSRTADANGFFEIQVDTSAIAPGADVLMKVHATSPSGMKGSLHKLTLHRI